METSVAVIFCPAPRPLLGPKSLRSNEASIGYRTVDNWIHQMLWQMGLGASIDLAHELNQGHEAVVSQAHLMS